SRKKLETERKEKVKRQKELEKQKKKEALKRRKEIKAEKKEEVNQKELEKKTRQEEINRQKKLETEKKEKERCKKLAREEVETKKKVVSLLSEARSLYKKKEYIQAKAKYRDVLKLDKKNKTALRYLVIIPTKIKESKMIQETEKRF
ncbi:MAG: hypothetical protein KAS46_00725, partial [Candidatus Aureabacteria bacterium]|nr:hypothetical protein [Candidatus Auribacterota bacterium]